MTKFDLKARAQEAADRVIDIWDDRQRWDVIENDLLDAPIEAAMRDAISFTLLALAEEKRAEIVAQKDKMIPIKWYNLDHPEREDE